MHDKKHELRDIEEEIMEVLFDMTISRSNQQRIKMGEILDKLGYDLAKTQLTNIVRRKLEPHGLVDYTPYDGILLTSKGYQTAKRIARNHRLAEAMLYQIFDVPFSELHEQACNIEHGISDFLAERIFQKIEDKKTPFGDVIPMADVKELRFDDQNLIDIPIGSRVILTRINSHTTNTASELKAFEIQGVGVKMRIKDRDKEGVTVELNNTKFKIPTRISKTLCVKPEE